MSEQRERVIFLADCQSFYASHILIMRIYLLHKERVFGIYRRYLFVLEGETMHRHIGRIIEIIYLDSKGIFTKRRIRVDSVNGDRVKAYCFTAKAPRVFRIDQIMAVQAVKRYA